MSNTGKNLKAAHREIGSPLRSPDIAENNKTGHTKGCILRQPGHLAYSRPVAFRPRLTTGLALSKFSYIKALAREAVNFKNLQLFTLLQGRECVSGRREPCL
jgi:hypothetical protein